MQIFSERLKELREEKKLSMFNLSRAIGISDAAICKWENSLTEPKATNIKTLCEFFEVSSDYLLGLENEYGAKKFAPPIKKKSAELSHDEKELLKIFQSLDPLHQKQILSYAQGFYHYSHPNKNFNF